MIILDKCLLVNWYLLNQIEPLEILIKPIEPLENNTNLIYIVAISN